MLTIFANMMINNPERFQHLKASFYSFNRISDNWLINIRGKLRQEVIQFFQENLGERMILFELLDEKRGWFKNSLEMIEKVKHNYILLWNEDHLNLAPQEIYSSIVQEMAQERVDYLMYSWWLNGQARQAFEVEGLKHHQYIDTVYLTKELWRKQLGKNYDDFLISLIGIFRKDFLIKLLKKERCKLPRFITTNIFRIMIVLRKIGIKFHHGRCFDMINRLFFGKLTKYPEGPFDFEKSPYRSDVLPLKMGLPKQELFACIDDDLGLEGYQLIKRGLYPPNSFRT